MAGEEQKVAVDLVDVVYVLYEQHSFDRSSQRVELNQRQQSLATTRLYPQQNNIESCMQAALASPCLAEEHSRLVFC